MARFFVSKDKISEGKIFIDGADAHHIARSLRMAEGDEAYVCDGEGGEYRVTLSRIRDEECVADIVEQIDSGAEPKCQITLFMAYPKGDKLETVIQKAVELGACRIVPFESSRCIKRPKAEKAEKQTARLARIAEEAAKQCGRAIIPEVAQPVTYKQMLAEATEHALSLFCYENEEGRSIKDAIHALPCPKSISIIVGSEGGFSVEEVDSAIQAGCTIVSLGNRILRCETAPSYALSAISYEYEL